MWAQVDQILRQASAQIADHVANFLPGMLVSLMLILATFVVAMLARDAAGASVARARLRPPGGAVGGWRPSSGGRRRQVRRRPSRASSIGRS